MNSSSTLCRTLHLQCVKDFVTTDLYLLKTCNEAAHKILMLIILHYISEKVQNQNILNTTLGVEIREMRTLLKHLLSSSY